MRLIDADRLINVVKNGIDFNKEYCLDNLYTKGYRAGMRNVYNSIINQPIIDPVKYGSWISYSTLPSFLRCNQCHNGIHWDNNKKPNYCPNCGAKMSMEE